METIVVLFCAGVLMALLGMILITSERELKKKRREVEELLARLESIAPGAAAVTAPQQAGDDAESASLRAQNRDLENQLAALSSELAQSRQSAEALQRAQRDREDEQRELDRLDSTNQQLVREVAELRTRLAAGEAQLQNARREDGQSTIARMQAEIDELRRTLESSHAKVRELEAARQNLPDFNAIQNERNLERQSFQEQIAAFEKRLATEQQNLAEMNALRERIAEAEKVQSSLRDEIQRHESEIPRWQARIAAAEESGRRLAALQAPFNELLAGQADLADRQRRLQENLAAFAQHIGAPAGGIENTQRDDAAAKSPASPGFAGSEGNSAGVDARQTQAAVADSRTHRFGVFGALFLIAATGIAGVQFLSSEWEQSAEPIVAVKAPEKAAIAAAPAAPITAPAAATNSSEPVAVKPAVAAEAAKPAARASDGPAAPRERLSAPRNLALGTYKVIQPGRVYAAPNELSRSLGDIEPGINVNVVDARDGWLEIHSKHGRPPGFIRREVAARVASAN